MPLSKFNNILIIRTDRIGDVVLTTPVFKALRKNYPMAKISVLVSPRTVDLVQGNPYIDQVLVDDRKGKHQGLFGFLQLARDLRKEQFDVVFIVHTKRRYNLACFLAGISCRIGYKNNKLGFLLTRPVEDQRQLGLKHESEYCLELLNAVGIKETGVDIFVPAQKENELWAGQWFNDHNVLQGEVIAIHPGASDVTRLWPVHAYVQLINALINRYSLKVVLIGGSETLNISSQIVRSCHSSLLDLTGKTTVGQMASVLRRCRLLISGDSGPLHVAAGVGIYVLCLFFRNQPGINPTRWRPLGPKAFMLLNKEGEEVRLDAKGQIKSGKLDSISVEQVLEQTERIFTEDNQSLFYW